MLRFLMVLVGLVFANLAMAVPAMMNYQGQLFLDGSPAAGPVSVTFRLYDAQTGGTLLWTETDVVQVQNGLFSTILGDGTTLPYLPFSGQTLWLETEVSGTPLSPRTQFVSTPYAYRSQRADTADVAITALGGGSQGPWSDDGTNITVQNRRVGVNTVGPGAQLDVFTNGENPYNRAINSQGDYGTGVTGSYTANFLQALYGTGSTGNVTGLHVNVQNLGSGQANAAVFTGGNVGINTTPLYTLDVAGDARFQRSGGSSLLFQTPATDVRIFSQSNVPLNLGTNGNALMLSIAANGNVGVPTADPNERFHVSSGNILLDNSQSLKFRNAPSTGAIPVLTLDGSDNLTVNGGNDLLFNSSNGGGTKMIVKQNGNVGIGTTNPTSKLHVVGDFCATGTKNRLIHDNKFGDLYYNSVESGEAIFTTSGRAQLKDGKCHVELDPKWLAGVTIDEQYPLDVVSVVFYGPHGNWYAVPGQLGFIIIDPSGSNAEFFWTVQARQKGYEDVYLDRKSRPTAAAEGR